MTTKGAKLVHIVPRTDMKLEGEVEDTAFVLLSLAGRPSSETPAQMQATHHSVVSDDEDENSNEHRCGNKKNRSSSAQYRSFKILAHKGSRTRTKYSVHAWKPLPMPPRLPNVHSGLPITSSLRGNLRP